MIEKQEVGEAAAVVGTGPLVGERKPPRRATGMRTTKTTQGKGCNTMMVRTRALGSNTSNTTTTSSNSRNNSMKGFANKIAVAVVAGGQEKALLGGSSSRVRGSSRSTCMTMAGPEQCIGSMVKRCRSPRTGTPALTAVTAVAAAEAGALNNTRKWPVLRWIGTGTGATIKEVITAMAIRALPLLLVVGLLLRLRPGVRKVLMV
mmetsp:Transcript_8450/g.14248  ORF Transcript_8450/g.14248 Transcript_8450/m.14248 type:complete len:204 (+) Transcript_8450:111-722(+)